jgi:hypothetical protein
MWNGDVGNKKLVAATRHTEVTSFNSTVLHNLDRLALDGSLHQHNHNIVCAVSNSSPVLSDCMEISAVAVSNGSLLFYQMV